MRSPRRPSRPTTHPPLTIVGAAQYAADECTALDRQLSRHPTLQPAALAVVRPVLRRAARVLEAAARELQDPIAHCPGCAAVAKRPATGTTGRP